MEILNFCLLVFLILFNVLTLTKAKIGVLQISTAVFSVALITQVMTPFFPFLHLFILVLALTNVGDVIGLLGG